MATRWWVGGLSLIFVLACGGDLAALPEAPVAAPAAPAAPVNPGGPDLTGLSGTWCYMNKFCYTYVGDTIIDEGTGNKGTWRQEGPLYISQFGQDAPWVATIEMYTATQLIVVPLDDNERIVYSKK